MDDAELVIAAREGTRTALAGIYDRYADRVHDVCFALLRDRAEAASVTQQAFLTAAERIDQLRDPARLRAWLFAIARHESVSRLRARAGTPAVAEVPPEILDRGEAVSLVWEGSAGLPARERALLDLALRQGLDGQDLADALGVSLSGSYVVLSNLRGPVERDLACYVLARRGSTEIPEVAKATQGWDGRFDEAFQKRVAKVDPDRVRRQADGTASPLALYSVLPLLGAPTALRAEVVDSARLPAPPSPYGLPAAAPAPAAPVDGAEPWQVDGFPPADFEVEEPKESRGAGAWLAVAALLLVLALIGGGLGYLLVSDDGSTDVAATDDTSTTTIAGITTTSRAATTTTNLFATTTTTLPAGPAPSGAVPGAPTTVTTAGAVAPGSTTTVTTAPGAGQLAGPAGGVVRFGTIDANGGAANRSLALRNTGRGPAAFKVDQATPGVSVTPMTGTIAPGGTATVMVSFNPSSSAETANEGAVIGGIRFGGNSGAVKVDLNGRVARQPGLADPAFQKTSSQTSATACVDNEPWFFSITATDDSPPVKRVVLEYLGMTVELAPISGTTRFQTPTSRPATPNDQDLTYTVRAFDQFDNEKLQQLTQKANCA